VFINDEVCLLFVLKWENIGTIECYWYAVFFFLTVHSWRFIIHMSICIGTFFTVEKLNKICSKLRIIIYKRQM